MTVEVNDPVEENLTSIEENFTPIEENNTPNSNLPKKRVCLWALLSIVIVAVAGIVGGTAFSLQAQSPSSVTAQPTPAPVALFNSDGNRIFMTTDELNRAVDFYMSNLTLKSEYGATMGDWDVSRIKKFDRLFDRSRNLTFELHETSGRTKYLNTQQLNTRRA